MIKLLYTIEVEPYDYTENEYKSPRTSKIETPEAWAGFWYECISDSNLQNLKPIETGSYFVEISKIGDAELKIILQNQLKEIDLSDFEEYLVQLCGGVVIIDTDTDKVIIEPSCCGDMSDIKNWESIEFSELNKWNHLWIGHPWVFYKKTEEHISFSDYTDYNLEEFKNISEIYRFPEQELISQIKEIRKNHDNFDTRIKRNLIEMGIDNAEGIAKLMTGND
jgi:hypothetical protein